MKLFSIRFIQRYTTQYSRYVTVLILGLVATTSFGQTLHRVKRHPKLIHLAHQTVSVPEKLRQAPGNFFWQQRAYPFSRIPAGAYDRAVQARDLMRVGRLGAKQSPDGRIQSSSKWKCIGPFNWNPLIYGENSWSGLGAVTGRVNALAYDPKTPSTIYAGGAAGGVFRSLDSGQTWISLTDSWKFLNVSSIAIDPANSKTLYVGTGDFQGGQGYGLHGGSLGHSFGLMKSTDYGATWKNLGVGQFDSYAISRVLVDPDNSQIITVTAGNSQNYDSSLPPETGGIWRSTDGGSSWKQATGKFTYQGSTYSLSARWCDVVATTKGTNGKRRYYAIGTAPAISGDSSASPILFFASDDQGATWQQISGPWKPANVSADVAVSPTNPGTVYVLANGDQTVFQSLDSGKTWKNINNNLSSLQNSADQTQWDQADYNYFLGCSTSIVQGKSQDVLYLGEKGIYQLPDGKTWNDFGTIWSDSNGNTAKLHTDQHCVVINPTNPNLGLFGNDGGVCAFAYNSATKTSTFTALNANLCLAQFYGADFHPLNPAIAIGGAQDNSTAIITGDRSKWRSVVGGDGGHASIDWNDPTKQYGTYVNFKQLECTTNTWDTDKLNLFDSLDKNKAGTPAWVVPVKINPTDSTLVYSAGSTVCTYDWTSRSWSYSNKVTTGSVLCIALSADGQTVYTGANDGQIWKSKDFGQTFKRIDNGTIPNRVVTSIVVSPTNPNAILVGLSGFGQNGSRLDHVWQCNNTSSINIAFSSVSNLASGMPDIPVNTIALDPIQPTTTFYAGTDIGVFSTNNGGKTWLNVTAPLGLPNVQVNELHVVPGQGSLYAVTFGRGIYQVNLTNGEPIYSLTLLPYVVKPKSSTTGTLLLGKPAPAGGITLKLTCDTPSVASVPTTVTAKAGATTITFPISTTSVPFATSVMITASTIGGTVVARTAQLIINP